ncbi:hypothetical protein [Dyella japonica]|uniref:Uncharacterized protein n=1 Tax=Dyella japonica A8 TaxID=1217721 RepID=A0A075K1H0_9GAMM|nr:hypothetical protein [Dyella japonica]AIF48206.1 hypothetical protein HY57_13560 [Dyella japonica A8]
MSIHSDLTVEQSAGPRTMAVLFLELDGVLDMTGSSESQLEEVLAPYLAQLEIVISDRRALHTPIETLRSKLPNRIASRVVDSMYLQELTNSCWSDYHSALATRYACLRLWLDRRRSPGTRWLALEQRWPLDSWPTLEREHLVCGPIAQASVRQQLTQALSQLVG